MSYKSTRSDEEELRQAFLTGTIVIPDHVLTRAKEFSTAIVSHLLETADHKEVRADNAAKARTAFQSPEKVAVCLRELDKLLQQNGGSVAWSAAARGEGITAGLLKIVTEQFPHRYRVAIDRNYMFGRERKLITCTESLLRDLEDVRTELEEAEEMLKESGPDTSVEQAVVKIRKLAEFFSAPERLAIHGVPFDRMGSDIIAAIPTILRDYPDEFVVIDWNKSPAPMDCDFDPMVDVGRGTPVLFVRYANGKPARQWKMVGIPQWA